MLENSLNITSIFNWKFILIYLVAVNLITFFLFGIDKRKAKKGKWRISEATLFIFSLIGGSIGGICGMYKFRHKTQKKRFKYGLPLILILEIMIVMFYMFTD